MKKKNQNTLDMIRMACVYNEFMAEVIYGLDRLTLSCGVTFIVRSHLKHGLNDLFKHRICSAILDKIFEPL